MKVQSILLALLVLFLSSSCEKEEPENITPVGPSFFSNLEVKVIECDDIACANVKTPSGIGVSLFQTEIDAVESFQQISAGITNAEGKVFFSGLSDYSGVFVKVDYEDQTYISYNSLGIDVTAFHDAIFVPGYSYDSNDQLDRNQDHISFSLPLQGQKSTYKYYFREDQDFDIPELEDVELTVRIKNKISDQVYLVSESLSSIPDNQYNNYPLYSENYWEFTTDSLIVTPVESLELTSCLFGYGYAGSGISKRFTLPISPPLGHLIDLDDYNNYEVVDWEPNMFMEDEVFLEREYDLLFLNLFSLQAIEGNLQLIAYNQNDGVARFLGFDALTSTGFGWVLITE